MLCLFLRTFYCNIMSGSDPFSAEARRTLLGVCSGAPHFCIGQKLVRSVCSAARPTTGDFNHRARSSASSRTRSRPRHGRTPGKLNGYCGERGGSPPLQHGRLFSWHQRITGGGIPIGTGAALALKYRGETKVAIVFFGDGASNQGTFHESLNMASLWKLPVLYVCENNRYGMSNPVEKACAGGSIAARADAYCIPAATADGLKVCEVAKATTDALDKIRSGGGPFLLELQTYRFCGHSKNEPRVYRSRAEEEQMQARDCMLDCRQELLRAGVEEQAIRQAEERPSSGSEKPPESSGRLAEHV